MDQRLEYHHVFKMPRKDIQSYIQGIPKHMLVRFAARLITVLSTVGKDFGIKEELNLFISYSNKSFFLDVLHSLQSQGLMNCKILDILSSYRFAEIVLAIQDSPSVLCLAEKKVEINLFTAYLLINSSWDAKHRNQDTVTTVDPKLDEFDHYLYNSFRSSDLVNYDVKMVYYCQIYKSIAFFDFMQNGKFEPLLSMFLQTKNCATYKEYVGRVMAFAHVFRDKTDNYFEIGLHRDLNFEENHLFLSQFSTSKIELQEDRDFLDLRKTPFYDVGESFVVVSPLFSLETLFKSPFFQILELSKSEYPNFRSQVSDVFSERVLFYEVMRNAFSNQFKHISGDEFKKKGYTAEPDYYTRKGNDIFIFESKDVYITSEIKHSWDYSLLLNALKSKFYFSEKDGKTSNKAIMQLINNAVRIVDKQFAKLDKDYNVEEIEIYPILVTHDRQFEAAGLNELLISWFDQELSNRPAPIRKRVRPITLIGIDWFIWNHQPLSADNSDLFKTLLNGFHSRSPEQRRVYNFEPFSFFANRYIDSLGLSSSHSGLWDSVIKKLQS